MAKDNESSGLKNHKSADGGEEMAAICSTCSRLVSQQSFMGRLRPEVQPLHFYIPLILTERVPFSYTYHGKYPLASTGGFFM